MNTPLLVISDIDGTLLPHVFFSGCSVEERRKETLRLIQLFRHKNFGILTGRRHAGFLRLFQEADHEIIYPAFAGFEWGSFWYRRETEFFSSPPDAKLQELAEKIFHALKNIPEFHAGLPLAEQLRQGKITTYVLEIKNICLQIESHFQDPNLREQFFNTVAKILNPFLLKNPEYKVQIFGGRIDVITQNFIPKTHFWDKIQQTEAHEFCKDNTTVIALGDELYDDYMFYDLRTQVAPKVGRTYTIAVKEKLKEATHYIPEPQEALYVVEKILEENNTEILNNYRIRQ